MGTGAYQTGAGQHPKGTTGWYNTPYGAGTDPNQMVTVEVVVVATGAGGICCCTA